MGMFKGKGDLIRLQGRDPDEPLYKYLSKRAKQKVFLLIAYWLGKFISFFTNNRVDKDKIIFMHYNNVYQCNPKYICDEIIRQGLKYDIVFATTKELMNKQPAPFPPEVRVVKRNSLRHFYEMTTARVWVDNALCFPWYYVPKKKSQIYINTWHGSMGLKRIDAENIADRHWREAARVAGIITDIMISNSEFETMVYRTTHWRRKNVRILEYGHPRNDILFCDEKKRAEIKKKVFDFFDIDEDCRIVLYAPTFRDDKNTDCYDIDHERLLSAVRERFGGKWKLLCRYHFKALMKMDLHKLTGSDRDVLQGNDYPDIQELMAATDIGITDYSSWICDFVLTGRPGFIYANDLQDYDKERGFYYPLESTPFPIARNNDEMESNILSFDSSKYEAEVKDFLKARGSREDGKAAERTVRLIKRFMEESS